MENTLKTRPDLEQRVLTLHRELASRDAEVEALREALDLFYNQWIRWNRHVQAHLSDLQAQVSALEAARPVRERSAAARPAPAGPPGGPVTYQKLITRIRKIARDVLPASATVLVVSRGDDTLLRLPGRRGWHFPQREDGVYAGYHPADSKAAIEHLEALRKKGADYLLIPGTSLWWLDYYKDFARHLRDRYRVAARHDDTCWIIDLSGTGTNTPPAASTEDREGYQALRRQIHALVAALLPADAAVLVVSRGDDELLERCGDHAQHFPQGPDGRYAGHYPATSEEAVAHLESLRRQGADYLLFPSTAFWWFDYYRSFSEHLEARYPVVCRQHHVCLIFALNGVIP